MISTDFVLYGGSGDGVEINQITASMQGTYWIFIFRLIILCIIGFALRISKISVFDLKNLKKYSSQEIAIGNIKELSSNARFRVGLFTIVAMISISRLFAGISNIFGEYYRLSVPIFVEYLLQISSDRYIHLVSSLFLALAAIIIISLSWEYFRWQSRELHR